MIFVAMNALMDGKMKRIKINGVVAILSNFINVMMIAVIGNNILRQYNKRYIDGN